MNDGLSGIGQQDLRGLLVLATSCFLDQVLVTRGVQSMEIQEATYLGWVCFSACM